MSPILRPLLTLLLAALATSAPASPQSDKPPQMRWQRTVGDARALSNESGVPMLLCVNVDNEVFCERFANERYRNPAFGQLAKGFVCVIVSPDRHNPRDHDSRGRRIPCPRFGTVTCGEHIAADADAYDDYFSGRRVAPRHIGVAPGGPGAGKQLFDRFLENSMSGVTSSLREHGVVAEPSATPTTTGALIGSRDEADRATIEQRFLDSDEAERTSIMRQAASADSEPFGLILLGLRDPAAAVRLAAQRALAASATTGALPMLLDALDTDLEGSSRSQLMAALGRIADTDDGARRAHTVREALDTEVPSLDLDAWRSALASDSGDWPSDAATDQELPELDARIDSLGARATASGAMPDTRIALGRATLRYALNRLNNQLDPTFLLEDVRAAATAASEDAATKPRAAALLARVDYLLDDLNSAGEHASVAMPSLSEESGAPFVARVLSILGKAHAAHLYGIEDPTADFPAARISEAHAAYQLLTAHPHGSETDALAHLDLLGFLGSDRHLREAARAAVRRYSSSAAVHERFRGILFGGDDLSAVSAAYAALRPEAQDAATWDWFGGYASLVVAEEYQRQATPGPAHGAYGEAIEQFDRSRATNQQFEDSASHFVALARAGRARLDMDAGRLSAAVDEMLACARTRTASFGAEDGLQRKPADTARRLLKALRQASNEDERTRLVSGLDDLGISL